jgi:hypothetical protein
MFKSSRIDRSPFPFVIGKHGYLDKRGDFLSHGWRKRFFRTVGKFHGCHFSLLIMFFSCRECFWRSGFGLLWLNGRFGSKGHNCFEES